MYLKQKMTKLVELTMWIRQFHAIRVTRARVSRCCCVATLWITWLVELTMWIRQFHAIRVTRARVSRCCCVATWITWLVEFTMWASHLTWLCSLSRRCIFSLQWWLSFRFLVATERRTFAVMTEEGIINLYVNAKHQNVISNWLSSTRR